MVYNVSEKSVSKGGVCGHSAIEAMETCTETTAKLTERKRYVEILQVKASHLLTSCDRYICQDGGYGCIWCPYFPLRCRTMTLLAKQAHIKS